MNIIEHIYTTVDHGITHVAADNKYIGSVNTYNNFFTRFFAWVSKSSMQVNFDGKTRIVNKVSYLNLVNTLTGTDVKIQNIKDHILFRKTVKNGNLLTSKSTMRDNISEKSRYKLFKKLARAISLGETQKACQMIGKGAALDRAYYDRGYKYPSFNHDTDSLSSESRYNFSVTRGTPILTAAKRSQTTVVAKLSEFGANTNATGRKYIFERIITGVDRRLEVVPKYRTVRRRDGRLDGNWGIGLETRTTVNTQDIRTNNTYFDLRTI